MVFTGLFLFYNLLILTLLLLLLMRLTCIVVKVQGTSMSPTFQNGDRILVLSWWPKCFLCKGQIVLFRSWYITLSSQQKAHLSRGQLHVKRIIALGGETLVTTLQEVREERRSYLASYHDEQGKRTWHIPRHHVFVRGDNRMNSGDSLTAGPLPLQSVCGVVVMKLPFTFYLFPRKSENVSAF